MLIALALACVFAKEDELDLVAVPLDEKQVGSKRGTFDART